MHVRRFDLLSSRFASRVFRWNVACSTAPRSSSKSKDLLYSNVHVEYGDDHTMQQQQQQQSLSTTAPSSSSLPPPPPKHNLTLYDFEGSPWCRLVREYATILDLTLHIRPCPRQTLFYGEGSFTLESKFRPEAMQLYKQMKRNVHKQSITVDGDGDDDGDDKSENEEVDDCMTFPLLVDRTQQLGDDDDDDDDADVIVLTESYEILKHLWERYGDTVIPTTISGNNTINNNHKSRRRSDQIFNSNSIPFILRFLSISGPSYVRPWPRCGIMRFPDTTTTTNNNNPSSNTNNNNNNRSKNTTTANDTKITLYQSEGCSESRLVREVLCSLEIAYRSVPVADGSSNILPISCMIRTTATTTTIRIPVLEVIAHDDGNDDEHDDHIVYRVGATECVDYLREKYYDADHRGSSNDPDDPTWFDVLPNNINNNEGNNNIGRIGGSISIGAYTAFLKGSRSFVPERVFE